jgi:hypothetical protein
MYSNQLKQWSSDMSQMNIQIENLSLKTKPAPQYTSFSPPPTTLLSTSSNFSNSFLHNSVSINKQHKKFVPVTFSSKNLNSNFKNSEIFDSFTNLNLSEQSPLNNNNNNNNIYENSAQKKSFTRNVLFDATSPQKNFSNRGPPIFTTTEEKQRIYSPFQKEKTNNTTVFLQNNINFNEDSEEVKSSINPKLKYNKNNEKQEKLAMILNKDEESECAKLLQIQAEILEKSQNSLVELENRLFLIQNKINNK